MKRIKVVYFLLPLIILGGFLFFTLQSANRDEFDVIGCKIFTPDGVVVRSYPGNNCVFLNDGSYIVSDVLTPFDFSLKRISSSGEVIWENRDIFAHHQMKLSKDGKSVLLISQTTHFTFGRMMRYGSVVRLGLDGKVISRWDSFKFAEEIEKRAGNRKIQFQPFELANWEHSHLNSVYEIPENPNLARSAAFAEGNIIVHLGKKDLFLILDPELKEILWSQVADPPFSHGHSAQILPNGNLLFLNNEFDDLYSRIVELDPFTMEEKWKFEGDPPSSFHSPYCGSVQKLSDERYLISDITNGGIVFEINAAGRILNKYIPLEVDPRTNKPSEFLEVNRVSLSDFFAN